MPAIKFKSMVPYFVLFLILSWGWIPLTQGEETIKMPLSGPIQTPAFQLLDEEWEFLPMAVSYDAVTSNTYKNQWGIINVPALWWEAKLPSTSTTNWKSAYNSISHAWYRKKFTLSSDLTTFNGRIFFGQVKWGCEVWLNGHYLGKHLGGYAPFDFEISPYMKPGEENELIMKVSGWGSIPFNAQSKPLITTGTVADWANKAGGITESVELKFYKRIALLSIFTIPDTDNGSVLIRVTIKNPKDLKPDDKLDVYITEKNSYVPISQVTLDIDKDPNSGIAGTEIQLDIPDVKLWWPWRPYMYQVTCMIKDKDNTPLDIRVENFGMRTVQIRDGHIFINGQRIPLRGANLFQETSYTIGSEATLDPKFAHKYLIEQAREAHINAFRTHLGPMNQRWLDLCDANGMLIISEFPVSQMSNEWEDTTFGFFAIQEYKELIPFLWNHPSIIMWSVSNESWTNEKRDVENKFVIPMIKSIDPTRPIMRAGDMSADIADIHAYEGVWYKSMRDFRNRVSQLKETNPDKPIFCTEYLETGSNDSGVWYDLQRAKRHLGEAFTVEDMLIKHAELAAEQTEILRLKEFDGIFPYFYADWLNLNSWVRNKDNKDYPKRKLTYYAIKNALSPTLAFFDLETTVFKAGLKIKVPVKVANDYPGVATVKVEVYVLPENPYYIPQRAKDIAKRNLFYDTSSSQIPPYSVASGNLVIPTSKKTSGILYLVAVLTNLDTKEAVISQRKIEIVK